MLALSSPVESVGEAIVVSTVTLLVTKNVVVAVVVGIFEDEDLGEALVTSTVTGLVTMIVVVAVVVGILEDEGGSEGVEVSAAIEVSVDVEVEAGTEVLEEVELEDIDLSEDIEDEVSVVLASVDEELSSLAELLQHVTMEPELESALGEAVAVGIGGLV